jgi:hypothetical protein
VKFFVPSPDSISNSSIYVLENVTTNNLNSLINGFIPRGTPDNTITPKSLIIRGSFKNSALILGSYTQKGFLTTNLSVRPIQLQFENYEYNCNDCILPNAKATASIIYITNVEKGLSANYIGFGKRSIAVPAEGFASNQDIVIQPINTHSVTVKSILRDGRSPSSSSLAHFVQINPGEAGISLNSGQATSETKINTPDISGALHLFLVSNEYKDTKQYLIGSQILDNNTTSASIELPKFISISNPKDGSILDPRKPNSWDWSGGSNIYFVSIAKKYNPTATADGNFTSFSLYTSKNKLSLEDYDVQLSPNSEYEFGIASYSIVSEINDNFATLISSEAYIFQSPSFSGSLATSVFKTLP